MCEFSTVATALPGDARSYSTHHAGVTTPLAGTVTMSQVAPPSMERFTPTLVAASTRSGFDGITE